MWTHCARELNAVDSKSTFVVGTNKYNNDITANLVARMKNVCKTKLKVNSDCVVQKTGVE